MFGTSAIAVFPLGTYRVFAVFVGQSACRLYVVSPELRGFVVASEVRRLSVAGENPTYIGGC